MPYYGAGDYYGAGGYYQAGGLGSFLKGVGRAAVGIGAALGVPGASVVQRAISPMPRTSALQVPAAGSPIPGLGGMAQRVLPGGLSGFYNRREYTKDGRPRRRRKDGQPYGIPSMNAGNTKAMRRAVRRANRFVSLARSALTMTKYGVYTRSSRASKRKG